MLQTIFQYLFYAVLLFTVFIHLSTKNEMFFYLNHKYNQVITDITTLNNAFHKPYLLSLELRTTLDLLYSNTLLEFSKKLHYFENCKASRSTF